MGEALLWNASNSDEYDGTQGGPTATHEGEKEDMDGLPYFSTYVRRVVEQIGPHDDWPA